MNSVVWSLTVYNGELIAGGYFTTAGGVAANYIARWDKPATCCVGDMRGNVDFDPSDVIDISDLVYLVDYMFNQGPAPLC